MAIMHTATHGRKNDTASKCNFDYFLIYTQLIRNPNTTKSQVNPKSKLGSIGSIGIYLVVFVVLVVFEFDKNKSII